MSARSQRGMALLVSLVFLLLLTLIGISSMQNATLQEKMAGSVSLRNQSFQARRSRVARRGKCGAAGDLLVAGLQRHQSMRAAGGIVDDHWRRIQLHLGGDLDRRRQWLLRGAKHRHHLATP